MTIGTAGVGGRARISSTSRPMWSSPQNGEMFMTDRHASEGTTGWGSGRRTGRSSKSGAEGRGPGEFNEPHTIAMDSRGRLFVGDRENNRIQIFDQDGTLIDEWTQFGRPSGIAITTRTPSTWPTPNRGPAR